MATTAVGSPFLIGFASLSDPIRRHPGGAGGSMMRHVFLATLPVRSGLALKVEKIPHGSGTFIPQNGAEGPATDEFEAPVRSLGA
jgi:hypothetical protein